MSEKHSKDPEHVAAGYKATIHNANVSQEAKFHAWEQLHKMGIYDIDQPVHQAPTIVSHSHPESAPKEAAGTEGIHAAKNEGNVIGGYKATLKNPHTSKEAKQHAESELQERGVDLESYEKEIRKL